MTGDDANVRIGRIPLVSHLGRLPSHRKASCAEYAEEHPDSEASYILQEMYFFSLTAHATIDPLNVLISHIIHPFVLSMIVDFRCQFRTMKSVLLIKCSRLHRDDFFIIA